MTPLPLLILLAPLQALAVAAEDREIVKVNGTPIRQSEVLERLWKRYGPETVEEMIDDLLLRQAAESRKVKAEPSEVEKRLAKVRSQFPDPKIFESQLQQSGMTLEKLKGEIAGQLSREKLVSAALKLGVKDEELKKAFDEHKEQLGVPAGVHLRHILVKTEGEAKEIVDKVKGGADFRALAKEKSLAPTAQLGGDYGVVSRGMLPEDIEAIAFQMKQDELRTLPSAKGWHVLQALEKRPAAPAEFGKVKDDLRDMLLQQKIRQALPDYLKELRQKAEIKTQGA